MSALVEPAAVDVSAVRALIAVWLDAIARPVTVGRELALRRAAALECSARVPVCEVTS